MQELTVADRQELILPSWIMTQEQVKERERILAGRFFLVKIAGNGLNWRCSTTKYGGCGGYHRYLTLRCVEQPFNGLSQGLWAYWKTVGAYGARQHLSLRERARFDALGKMLGSMPDLAESHPMTARRVGTGEHDADFGAYTFTASELSAHALGVMEVIDRDKAARLARRINMRGIKPPFVLEGLRDVS